MTCTNAPFAFLLGVSVLIPFKLKYRAWYCNFMQISSYRLVSNTRARVTSHNPTPNILAWIGEYTICITAHRLKIAPLSGEIIRWYSVRCPVKVYCVSGHYQGQKQTTCMAIVWGWVSVRVCEWKCNPSFSVLSVPCAAWRVCEAVKNGVAGRPARAQQVDHCPSRYIDYATDGSPRIAVRFADVNTASKTGRWLPNVGAQPEQTRKISL